MNGPINDVIITHEGDSSAGYTRGHSYGLQVSHQ